MPAYDYDPDDSGFQLGRRIRGIGSSIVDSLNRADREAAARRVAEEQRVHRETAPIRGFVAGIRGDTPEDEPIGDFARRQGMVEEAPRAEVERGAHQALAENFAGRVVGPGESKDGGAEIFPDPFGFGAAPIPMRTPGSPGFGEPAPAAAAAPPPPAREPLSVRYKDKEGNWKTHTLGQAAPTDIARSMTAYDPSEGRTESFIREDADKNLIDIRPAGGGGVSTANMESLPLGQRPASFFEDDALKTAMAESAAKRKLADTLAADPFAREKAAAEQSVGSAGRIAEIQSGIRQAEERRREQGYSTEVRRLAALRDQELAKVAALPPEDPRRRRVEQKAQEIYEEEVRNARETAGFGARLGQAVTGR